MMKHAIYKNLIRRAGALVLALLMLLGLLVSGGAPAAAEPYQFTLS